MRRTPGRVNLREKLKNQGKKGIEAQKRKKKKGDIKTHPSKGGENSWARSII